MPPSKTALELTPLWVAAMPRTIISAPPETSAATAAKGIELKDNPNAAPTVAPAAPAAETPTIDGAASGFKNTP